MAIKQTAHIIKGLRRDFSNSKQPKEYAIDAKNIRITNREDSSLLSITNEKGTQEVTFNNNISGNYLGHTTINDILVLFTRVKDNNDYIYKINLSNNTNITLFEGKLSDESIDHIEALGVYESEDIQKVYWVDGVSQPRMINIKDETLRTDVKEFDFIQELQLNETIKVEKSYSSGSFNSGVIQYAFNYYNKNGQESNIVEVTPINYISYEDRGATPNDYVSNSFKITISNYDKNFDYLRLYSIHRTSLDAIPSVKIVADINLRTAKSTAIVNYIDTGIVGETIDPVELLYKGGEYIIPKTLAQKDGTLFLGNIKLKNINQLKEDTPPTDVFNKDEYPVHHWRTQSHYKFTMTDSIPMFSWKTEKVVGKIDELTGYYPYKAYLGKGDNTTFKSKETYRLGIQFQDNTGKWSDPIVYKDVTVDKTPTLDESNNYLGVQGKLYIADEIVNWAKENNYKKVRPVVVYPQEGERDVVAQGILCPTVFNAKDRQEGTCFAQSSWFLRPSIPNSGISSPSYRHDKNLTNDNYILKDPESEGGEFIETDIPKYGAWAEFRHYKCLPSYYERNSEIQSFIEGTLEDYTISGYSSNINNTFPYITTDSDDVARLYLETTSNIFSDAYYVDQSIVTFHSPEIELGKVFNLDSLKVRVVGLVQFKSNAGDLDIKLSSAPIDTDILNINNVSYVGTDVNNDNQIAGARSLISGLIYSDKNNSDDGYSSYMIYPWQRSGSLNPINRYQSYAVLKNKKLSNLKFSYLTKYLENVALGEEYLIPSNISLFNGENSIRIPTPKNSIFIDDKDYLLYKGNVDSIVTPYNGDLTLSVSGVEDLTLSLSEGRYRAHSYTSFTKEEFTPIKAFNNIVNLTGALSGITYDYNNNPISIKYKSTPHAVISLDYGLDDKTGALLQKRLDTLYVGANSEILDDKWYVAYGNNKFQGFKKLEIIKPLYNLEYKEGPAYLWLAELYRDSVSNKFGGDNYESNIWYPAGKSVKLPESKEEGELYYNTYVEFTQGDTFFARFDSLKTYSDDLDAVNSVTEIGSFMVETRINLDARYDRNRGKQSNLVMNPGNFNLFNDVYNQKNNFFNYRIIDKDIADNTKFPNTIVWSKQKFAGADVDPWTNINMASSLDLDGTKGELTKLVSFKNEIFSFQPEAINHILFNSRVQIPTSDGVPIELTNAYKVDGARQLSSIGSSNPLAIKSTDRGIYYMDNITKGIYVFNGQQSESLSDKLGMSSWVKEQNIDSYKVNYDKINQDIYFINNDNCLSYSEKLGEFESFFDYNDSEIFNVKDGTYAIKSNKLYKLFEGNYNRFFTSSKPFWITFTHNENPFNDKIYNTLEFRADTYNYITKDEDGNDITPYWELSNNSSFNKIKVYNKYQDTKEVSLEFNRFTPSNLKRKFRIWRANIPRDFIHKRDRIRNAWANITLKASNPSNTKTELHDLVVSYFM